jgi:glutamate dehydrogenase
MLIETSRLLERGTTWFLRSRRLSDEMGGTIARVAPRVEALADRLTTLTDPADRARVEAIVQSYVSRGVPEALATRVVTLNSLYATLDIVEVADATARPVELVAEIYFAVSTRLGVPWLRAKIAALPADQHWRMLARGAMEDDLSGLQRTITSEVLTGAAGIAEPAGLIDAWSERNRRAIARTEQLLAELRAAPEADTSMLAVALRELRSLA